MQSDGCYSLVGENRFTSITLANGLVSETPEATNVVSVRPGDVVGYFSITELSSNGGIQLHHELLTRETVWYHTSTGDNPLMAGVQSCPFPVGSESDRILSSSTNLGPIVSIMGETLQSLRI